MVCRNIQQYTNEAIAIRSLAKKSEIQNGGSFWQQYYPNVIVQRNLYMYISCATTASSTYGPGGSVTLSTGTQEFLDPYNFNDDRLIVSRNWNWLAPW